VIGSVRRLKVFQVTRSAGGGQAFEDAACVALHAGCDGMRAGEREDGLGGVIERGPVPIDSGMAKLAILRKSGGGVVRVGGALIVLEVTR